MRRIITISFLLFAIIFIFVNNSFAQKISRCNPQKLIPVKYKQSGYYVKNLQLCLIKLGIDIPSGATGYYGKQTAEAVKTFYKLWYRDVSGYSIESLGIKKLKELISLIPPKTLKVRFEKFKSDKDFLNYLLLKNIIERPMAIGMEGGSMAPEPSKSLLLKLKNIIERPMAIGMEGGSMAPEPSKSLERVSETTVQVKGIDEPDIVKSDGYNIYFSKESHYRIYRPRPLTKVGFEPLPPSLSSLIISAFPLENLKILSKIDKGGNLLLLKEKKVLIIFEKNLNQIYGYDISDPENPKEKWNIALKNASIITARLFKEKIYLATKNSVSFDTKCPIQLFQINYKEYNLDCKDVYHPNILLPLEALYTISIIDPKTGSIEKIVSFLGSHSDSVFYMSSKNIYLTYYLREGYANLIIDFLTQATNLLPSNVIQKLVRLKDYEISDYSKLSEVQIMLENYLRTLSSNEQLKVENEIRNRFEKYYSLNKTKFEKTILVKINNETLEINSTGSVPGYPLNQFSLDEYNDNLRIAVTVGNLRIIPVTVGGKLLLPSWDLLEGTKTINNVYILDKDLRILSSVEDLGIGERIYSVRFIEDKGYVVTFRETDPFYVLDLSDPNNPQLKGELKIPGYSSYLHPITKDKILGIGKEGQNVKISLFDVSNPENPIEKDKYTLNEYWSEVLNNFHAFLLDDKHQIFFIPAGNGGYIFSYKDDKLNLVKTMEGYDIKRSIFINDYLYIISGNKITVLNELNWNIEKELFLE